MVDEFEKTEEIKELICPICKDLISPEDWNSYYNACEKCLDNSGRIGS